jgi:hypothetical protein
MGLTPEPALLGALRGSYHRQIGEKIVRWSGRGKAGFPNFADGSSRTSIELASRIAEALGWTRVVEKIDGQSTGHAFEQLTCQFLEHACEMLQHLRPGKWAYRVSQTAIEVFTQDEHLRVFAAAVKADPNLAAVLDQGYIIKPDIIIARHPWTDDDVNRNRSVVQAGDATARLTQMRACNQAAPTLLLHASISCKWTIRSDRSQNTRTEALNLIRNRKGRMPHIVAVTAEPLPMQIASLALGTGDLDCVYHFALPELRAACAAAKAGQDQLEMLDTMVQGQRLRDISDLPFDLTI